MPIENGTKAILISGIGSDTGIQREHKARLGLASVTDVGYFTWLRDAHELDLATMEWKTALPANHNTIRHEGLMGFIAESNLIVNWGGTIPSSEFGKDAINCEQCSCAVLSVNTDFKNLGIQRRVSTIQRRIFSNDSWVDSIIIYTSRWDLEI